MFSESASSDRIDGFDARSVSDNVRSLWTPNRRGLHLLKSNVWMPFSVDCLVWPSLFDWKQGVGLSAVEREDLFLKGIPVPEDYSWSAPLWESMHRLVTELETQTILAKYTPFWLVHITSRDGYAPTPGETFLGFDVATNALLSGLSNCGLGANDKVRSRFENKINDHHLLSELDDAAAFALECNEIIPEHAPFNTIGVYRFDPMPSEPHVQRGEAALTG